VEVHLRFTADAISVSATSVPDEDRSCPTQISAEADDIHDACLPFGETSSIVSSDLSKGI
jgi:hypothetical protein